MFREYRKKRGYTQEELAELMNISWRQVQRIEIGSHLPNIINFAKIVIALKIDEKDVMKYLKEIAYEKN